MSADRDLQRLKVITNMRLEARLATLRQAASRRDAVVGMLGDVTDSVKAAREVDLPDRGAALLHEAWGERRRRALNIELARQTAALDELRSEAALALSQDRTVDALRERLQLSARTRQQRKGQERSEN